MEVKNVRVSRPQTALTAISIGLGFLVAGHALGDEVRAIEGEAPALPEIRLITTGDRAGVTVPAAADPAREALALMAEKIRRLEAQVTDLKETADELRTRQTAADATLGALEERRRRQAVPGRGIGLPFAVLALESWAGSRTITVARGSEYRFLGEGDRWLGWTVESIDGAHDVVIRDPAGKNHTVAVTPP